MNTDLIVKLMCVAVTVTMICYYKSRERKISSFLLGALTGMTALFLINKYGFHIGAEVPLNMFNLCGSIILGVPFVICTVIIKFL